MAINNRYDEEDVDGATSFQKGEITTSTQSNPTNNSKAHRRQSTKTRTMKSTSQVLPTSRQAHREAIYQDTHREVDREVYLVDQDFTEAANQERTHDVDKMVTEADFE